MYTNKNTPFLHFDFTNKNNEKDPLSFSNPLKIIYATKIEDVLNCLELVQKETEQGYYAAGYMSYEAAPAFIQNITAHNKNEMPLVWFGIFEKPLTNKTYELKNFGFKKWQPMTSVDQYNKNIDKIHKYIKAERTKQVNYTIQMKSNFIGDSFSFYKQLTKAQAANYTAYLNIGDHSILSASPELFFRLKDNEIKTKPMKGTANRGLTYEEDIQNAHWLKNSNKNKQENDMIVQLMKRDLEKIAIENSIEVTKQYEIEKYPTVYQMTSTVTAKISDQTTITDIFKALFPCGSITGSPRKATMEIIHELEESPRGVYCGAIGYITPDNEAVFNVPIRTVTINNKNGNSTYGVGGAITEDSTKKEEYEEVLIKSKLLTRKQPDFKLLETIKLKNGQYFLLDKHLDRLKKSAAYFNYSLDMKVINDQLVKNSERYNDGCFIVRLLSDNIGSVIIESNKLTNNNEEKIVALAKHPINKHDLFLYHKTTNRRMYEKLQQKEYFDVLLWNSNEELTEFTIGNLVVKFNGELVTPPQSSGLLNGTFRSLLLDEGKIIEKKLFISDLDNCEEIWLINSVREWVQVTLN